MDDSSWQFLILACAKDGEDKRFRSILPSFTQLFMTELSASGSLFNYCQLWWVSYQKYLLAFLVVLVWLFDFGFIFEVVAEQQKPNLNLTLTMKGIHNRRLVVKSSKLFWRSCLMDRYLLWPCQS